MRFFRRNKYPLLCLAVLLLSGVMVLRQFMANQSAHVELREDFILLLENGDENPATRLYQLLIQQLPELSDHALVEDIQRTAMSLGTNSTNPDHLLWKYQRSARNELHKRADRRIERARARAQIP
jgi:hypothetical protein